MVSISDSDMAQGGVCLAKLPASARTWLVSLLGSRLYCCGPNPGDLLRASEIMMGAIWHNRNDTRGFAVWIVAGGRLENAPCLDASPA